MEELRLSTDRTSAGPLVSTIITMLLAVSHRAKIAIGLVVVPAGRDHRQRLDPAPLWFKVVDLVVAYIPMTYLGWRLAGKK